MSDKDIALLILSEKELFFFFVLADEKVGGSRLAAPGILIVLLHEATSVRCTETDSQLIPGSNTQISSANISSSSYLSNGSALDRLLPDSSGRPLRVYFRELLVVLSVYLFEPSHIQYSWKYMSGTHTQLDMIRLDSWE